MALGALTLSVTQGVQGRPFAAKINGLTTGRVKVMGDGSPGFSVANGIVYANRLPYPTSTVVLREYEPGVGAGFRDSRIDITAATGASLTALAVASLGQGRKLVRTRVGGVRQPDGSFVYSLIVDDDLGASVAISVGTPAPSPTPTPTPGFRVDYLDDGGASSGLWYGNSAGPAWVKDASADRVLGVVQRYNFNAGAALQENTALIYDTATQTATIGGVIMIDSSSDGGSSVGDADQHGVGALAQHPANPSIWWSAGGAHGQPMKLSRSTDGGVTWVAMGTLGTDLTYPHLVVVNGVLYMFARRSPGGNTYPLVYYRSTAIAADGVVTWSGARSLIDAGADARIYAGRPVVSGALILLPWCRAAGDDSVRRDLHVGVLDTSNDTFRNLANTISRPANTAITRAEADASFRMVDQTTSGTEETNTPSIWVDAEGLHAGYQGGTGGLTLKHARWSLAGVLAEGPTDIGTVTHRYATASIGPKAGGGVEVLYPSNVGAPNDMDTQAAYVRGGNVYRTERTGPGVWSAATLVKACTPVHPFDGACRVEGLPGAFAFYERAIDDNDFGTGGNLRTYMRLPSGQLATTPFVEDPDAAAYIGGAAYSDADRAIVTTWFRGAKRAGWFERGDAAYLLAEPVEAVARKNALPGNYPLTDAGTGIVHTPRSGMDGSATGKLTAAFNPLNASGKRITGTSVNLAVYATEDVTAGSSDIGTTSATTTLALNARSAANNFASFLGDATATNRAVTRADLLLMAQRVGGTKESYVRTKASRVTASVAATALPDGNLTLLGNGTGFSQRRLGYAHLGSQIDVGPIMQVIKRYVHERIGAA